MCDYPWTGDNCDQTLADLHSTFFNRTRAIAALMGVASLLFAVLSSTKSKTMTRVDGKIGALFVLAALVQCIRAYDPAGMGDEIDYKYSLTCLWVMSTIAANAQVGSLSGYLLILDRLTPSKVALHAKVFRLSKIVLYFKMVGDIVTCILFFVIPEQLPIIFLVSFVLSSGVYIVHPAACYYFSNKLATASRNVWMHSANANGRMKKEKSAAYDRLKSFSIQIRLLALANVFCYFVLVIYCLLLNIHFESSITSDLSSDPFTDWPVYYGILEFVLPLIHLSMLFCCLKVFAKAAEVVQNRKFQSVIFGLVTVVALIVACVADEEFDDDDE